MLPITTNLDYNYFANHYRTSQMSIITSTNRNFFYLVVLLACFFTYMTIRPYLASIVLSLLAAIMYRPLYVRCLRWCRGRKAAAMLLTMIAMTISLLAPLALVANVTIRQALQFTYDLSNLVAGGSVTLRQVVMQTNNLLESIPLLDYEITEAGLIKSVQQISGPVSSYLANSALAIGSTSIQLITQVIVFVSVLITVLPITPRVLQIAKDLSPLDDTLDHRYIQRITAMARAMVRGVFVIALAQGVAAGIFLAIGGVPYVAFWTLLCIAFAFLPLGVNVITVPAGIVLIAFGSVWQGLLVIIGGLLVVSNIDTILRPLLVPKEANINSALVLIGALGGLHLFGFLGVIYGPVVMIFLVTTVEIYLEHYRYGETEAATEVPVN